MVQKLSLEKIVIPSLTQKVQYVLAEKRKPIQKIDNIVFNEDDSVNLNINALFADPDSIQNELGELLQSV